MGFLSGWTNRVQFTVTGSTVLQNEYQIRLVIHSVTGTNTSTDFYCDGLANSDFSDIRFTKSDGTTLLSYWIESFVPGDYAIVWVKLEDIPASPGTVDFFFYYGNSSAVSLSDGSATFFFFDDFEGTTQTPWYSTGSNNLIIATDQYYHGSYSLKKPYYSSWEKQYTLISLPASFRIIVDFRTSDNGYENRICLWNETLTELFLSLNPSLWVSNDQSIIYYVNDVYIRTSFGNEIPSNAWREYEVIINGSQLRAREIKDNSGDTGWLSFDGIPYAPNYAFGINSKPESYNWLDCIRICNYILPEPSITSIGEKSWNPYSFDYKKLFTVEGSTSSVTDYQIQIIVHKGAGTDYSNHIFLDGNCKDDFSDLRFANSSDELLNYWIESYTLGDQATIWVKLDSVAPGSNNFYLYYGNSSAGSLSNGTSTFLFFDDFENSGLTWIDKTGTWTNVSGQRRQTNTSPASFKYSYADVTLPTDYIVGVRIQSPTVIDDDGRLGILVEDSTTNALGIVTQPKAETTQICLLYEGVSWYGDALHGLTLSTGNWYRIEAYRSANIQKGRLWSGNLIPNWQVETNLSSLTNKRAGLYGQFDEQTYFDFFYVRNFTSPEPYISSTGEGTNIESFDLTLLSLSFSSSSVSPLEFTALPSLSSSVITEVVSPLEFTALPSLSSSVITEVVSPLEFISSPTLSSSFVTEVESPPQVSVDSYPFSSSFVPSVILPISAEIETSPVLSGSLFSSSVIPPITAELETVPVDLSSAIVAEFDESISLTDSLDQFANYKKSFSGSVILDDSFSFLQSLDDAIDVSEELDIQAQSSRVESISLVESLKLDGKVPSPELEETIYLSYAIEQLTPTHHLELWGDGITLSDSIDEPLRGNLGREYLIFTDFVSATKVTPSEIYGTVVETSDKVPSAYARVCLIQKDPRKNLIDFSVTTDENGNFFIDNVPNGTFVLVSLKRNRTIGLAEVQIQDNIVTGIELQMEIMPNENIADQIFNIYQHYIKYYTTNEEFDEENEKHIVEGMVLFGDLYQTAKEMIQPGTGYLRGFHDNLLIEPPTLELKPIRLLDEHGFFESGENVVAYKEAINWTAFQEISDFEGFAFKATFNSLYETAKIEVRLGTWVYKEPVRPSTFKEAHLWEFLNLEDWFKPPQELKTQDETILLQDQLILCKGSGNWFPEKPSTLEVCQQQLTLTDSLELCIGTRITYPNKIQLCREEIALIDSSIQCYPQAFWDSYYSNRQRFWYKRCPKCPTEGRTYTIYSGPEGTIWLDADCRYHAHMHYKGRNYTGTVGSSRIGGSGIGGSGWTYNPSPASTPTEEIPPGPVIPPVEEVVYFLLFIYEGMEEVTRKIYGTVYEKRTGNVIPDIPVKVYWQGQLIGLTITDSNGYYEIGVREGGEYHVVVDERPWKKARQWAIISSNAQIDFYLELLKRKITYPYSLLIVENL